MLKVSGFADRARSWLCATACLPVHRATILGCWVFLLGGLAGAIQGDDASQVPQELTTPNYRIRDLTGIGSERGVERQDPSNVLRVGDTYYVWYTRRTAGVHPYASTVYYATSTDGIAWSEQGEALGKAPDKQAWDSFGVITPYVAAVDDRYYLFYTGTSAREPFRSRDPGGTKRQLGVAVAATPQGPWRRFADNPVLGPGEGGAWDDLLVDDAHVIVRDGRYWLYFKGGHGTVPPSETKWGLATADRITGPYRKHAANPLVGGHTVCVWPHREGVAALIDHAGPQRHTVQWSADGIHFVRAARTERPVLTGCGPFAPDAFADDGHGDGITWGVAQRRQGRALHIARFEIDATAPPAEDEAR